MYFKLKDAEKKELRELMDVLKKEHSTIETDDFDLLGEDDIKKETGFLFSSLCIVYYDNGNPYEIGRSARRYRAIQFEKARKNNDPAREQEVREYVKRCVIFSQRSYQPLIPNYPV